MAKKYWLMKSEPEAYSIDDLARDTTTLWSGVRNYQARNFMMNDMRIGDKILFYHSNAEPSGVAGFAEVSGLAVPDPTAQDPKSEYFDPKASSDHPIWFCVQVKFVRKLASLIPLSELRERRGLESMLLLQKGQRLSVQPVTAEEFAIIEKMAGGARPDAKAAPPTEARPGAKTAQGAAAGTDLKETAAALLRKKSLVAVKAAPVERAARPATGNARSTARGKATAAAKGPARK